MQTHITQYKLVLRTNLNHLKTLAFRHRNRAVGENRPLNLTRLNDGVKFVSENPVVAF